MVHPLLKCRREFRPAFTLMELLIVISIIALLVGASLGAYWYSVTSTQTGATKTTLKKTQNILDNQWKNVSDQARTDPLPAQSAAWVPAAVKGADNLRALWVSLRQTEAFPFRFKPVVQPPAAGWPQALVSTRTSYQTYLANYGITQAFVTNTYEPAVAALTTVEDQAKARATEASICLLMALQRGPSGGGFTIEDIGKATVQNLSILGMAGSQIPALVDAWNQPFLPYTLQPPSGKTLYTLTTIPPASNGLAWTANQPQSPPWLISGGADNKFGLDPTTLAPSPDPAYPVTQAQAWVHLKDNLYSK